MAIKVLGTTVIDDDRNVVNVNNLSATGNVIINSLLFPDTDGAAGQVLTTDGSGNITFRSTGVPAYSAF